MVTRVANTKLPLCISETVIRNLMKFQDHFTISCNDENRDALLNIEQEKYWAQGLLENIQLVQQRSNQIHERARREMDKVSCGDLSQ